jgi:hypothetical protein
MDCIMLSRSPATVDDGTGGASDASALALALSPSTTTAAAAVDDDDDGCAAAAPRLFFALTPAASCCCRAVADSDRDRFDCAVAGGLAVLPVAAVVVVIALPAAVALRR